MKYIFLILIFLFPETIFAQKQNIKSLSIHEIDSIFKVKFKILAQQSKHKEDSLQRELLVYKTKESYYNTLLGFQSGVAFTVIGSILTLLGIFSWIFTNNSVKKNQKLFDKKLKEIEQINIELEYELVEHASLLYISGTVSLRQEKDFSIKFDFMLSAILFKFKALKMTRNTDYNILISLTRELNALFGKINSSQEPTLKDRMSKQKDFFLTKINKILNIENNDIKTIISEMRLKMITYYKTIETTQNNA